MKVNADGDRRARPVSFSFHVDTPYPTAHVPEFPASPATPADSQSFITMPGVKPPVMTVTGADRDPASGDIFVTNGPGPGQYGPLIYTPQGRLVWFEHLTGETTAENLSVQELRGQRVLTWWKGRVLSLGFGQGEDVVMSSSYEPIAHVAGGNGLKADLHDFQLSKNDVAYITAFNPIRCDLRGAGGPADGAITDTAVQEIDIPSGLVRWEWHSLDHVTAAESEVEAPSTSTPWDYFHVNSIDPQDDGRLMLSARSTWAGYELEAGSGRIQWRLGGNHSSFKMGPGTEMAWQHDGRMRSSDEVTFFDDGSNPPIHKQSRGLVIALDLRAKTARLVKSFDHPDPPVLAASQGNMQTLSNGNVLIGYGGVAADQRVRPRRLTSVRRPPALRHVLLPRLPLPLERASGNAAGDRGEREQHRRRDDRARELERRHRRRLLARARRRIAADAVGASNDPVERLRERGHAPAQVQVRGRAGARQRRSRARHIGDQPRDRVLRGPDHSGRQTRCVGG